MQHSAEILQSYLVALLVTSALAACHEATPLGIRGSVGDEVLAPDPQRAAQIASEIASGASVRLADDMLSFLNATVPGGVGGVFRDPEGFLNVYLKDRDQRGAAASQLLAVQSANGAPPGGVRFTTDRIRFLQADFTWDELRGWYERILQMPDASPYIHTWDIDERRNRIHLGVEDEASGDLVRTVLKGADVPAAAVTISVEPRAVVVQAADDLGDTDSPNIRGGFSVHAGAGACTLTVNTEMGSSRGFLTASHCTATMGAVDGDDGVQAPYPTPGWRKVADEIADPPFFDHTYTPHCPLFKTCRFSDAAMFAYDQTSYAAHGIIARPYLNSINLDPSNPDFYIADDDPGCILYLGCGLIGDTMWKVGRSTGLTVGVVDKNCVEVTTGTPSRTYICQSRVDGASGSISEGDSGAPVFEMTGSEVNLFGMVHARLGTDKWWFSLTVNIRTDFNRVGLSFETVYEGPGPPESRVGREKEGVQG